MPNIQKIKILFLLLLVFLVIGGSLGATYFFYTESQKNQKELSALKSGTPPAANDYAKIISAVGELMKLPTAQPDTVYTIKDKDQLKDQPFFSQSLNGDVLLVYTQAQKAILYRPSINKIIDITAVSINPSNTSQTTGAVSGAKTGIIASPSSDLITP